jgi:hypothetical protein
MRIMGRFTMPVDDDSHGFRMRATPAHVVAVTPDRIEFWAETDTEDPGPVRVFRVFGTGHPLPTNVKYVGTCQRIAGLVWHLYEVVSP